jgi:hypothetical protein
MSALPITESLEDQFRQSLKVLRASEENGLIATQAAELLRQRADELEAEADRRNDEATKQFEQLREALEKAGGDPYSVEEERV